MTGLPNQAHGRFGTARGSHVSNGGGQPGAPSSVLGISMNLDFHPRYLLDKSNLPAGGQNLQQIFNDGDVSMMDEMNKLLTGLNSNG